MFDKTLLEQIEGIIFDVDGTLLDSMWIWPAVDDDYLAKYNLTEPENFHEDMEGMSYTETAQFFLDSFPTLTCTIEEIQNEWMDMVYEKYMTEVDPKPGAIPFIQKMRELGLKIGIATSNSKKLVEDTLRALRIEALFDSVRSSCEVSAGKPAPDVYLLVAEELGVDPYKCLVFEDVPKGIMAGKNAGMTVCAVEDEFSIPQREKKRQLADFYINDYYEVL